MLQNYLAFYRPANFIIIMQSKKGQNSTSQSNQQKLASLRKINPTDKFPCFLCFDDPKQKQVCEQCKANGWILGSHPMVQFAEDFIEKRLAGMLTSDFSNSSGNQNDFGEIMAKMSGSYDPQKKPIQVFPILSSKTLTLDEQIRESRKREVIQQYHQAQYFCNQCITIEPIKGKRYHCKECDDFDLCESCFNGGAHAQHQMKEILPFRRPDSESLVAQAKLNLLKKTVKFAK